MIVVNVFKIATGQEGWGQRERKKRKMILDESVLLFKFFFFLESSLKISAYIDCVPWSLLSKWDWKTAFKNAAIYQITLEIF